MPLSKQRKLDPSMKMVRIEARQWDLICDLARQHRRSGTQELLLVIDRGLGGRAGYELAKLDRERTEKIMGDRNV